MGLTTVVGLPGSLVAGATELARALEGRRSGADWHARCPVPDHGRGRGDLNPSLAIAERDGRILVHCHGGCSQRDVIAALQMRGLWNETPLASGLLRNHESGASRRSKYKPWSNKNVVAAQRIWREALPAPLTLVKIYLESRGIRLQLPPSLRFQPSLKHGPTGLWFPTMVAAVQAPDRRLAGIHRTFLRPDGASKANISHPKMSLGRIRGGAVRLGEIGPRIGICEGIETGLAVRQAEPSLPVWVGLSASGMRSVGLPDEIREVVLLADGDDAGELAARETAQRLVSEGRNVSIARAPTGHDFNDLLNRQDGETSA